MQQCLIRILKSDDQMNVFFCNLMKIYRIEIALKHRFSFILCIAQRGALRLLSNFNQYNYGNETVADITKFNKTEGRNYKIPKPIIRPSHKYLKCTMGNVSLLNGSNLRSAMLCRLRGVASHCESAQYLFPIIILWRFPFV